jgi:hypothetical protein
MAALTVLNNNALAEQNNALDLRIDGYDKGELELMVAPFGLDGNEINIGKVLADGRIQFEWPNLDVKSIDGSEYFMTSVARAAGMSFCSDKTLDQSNEAALAVDSKNLFLYKDGQQVGALYPATAQAMQNNASLNRYTSLVLGSELSWYYSDSETTFVATCSVGLESEGIYNFKEVTTYNLDLKPGWNLVQSTLSEKEDRANGEEKGSLPKAMSKSTASAVPANIKWHLKYWGG